ncbi:hypothetical protein JL721_12844 [Aureococcus anophagefferens]|nr:hypothetical protein JL721_12844 [Aureococcus anophagefferens]
MAPQDIVKAQRDRYLYVLSLLVGQKAEAELLEKKTMTGVLHTATPFSDMPHRMVLKGAAEKGTVASPASTVVLGFDKIACLTFSAPRMLGDPRSSGFRTDGDIARPDRGLEGRALEQLDSAWLSAPKVKGPAQPKGGKKWDQFEANERLFGASTGYDENVYTTKLDDSAFTPAQKAEAARIAAEIENATTSNIHLAEERGQEISTDMDEEDRFGARAAPLPRGSRARWRRRPAAPAPAPAPVAAPRPRPPAPRRARAEAAPAPAPLADAAEPEAKAFQFNVGAAEWTPSFAAAPPPPPPAPSASTLRQPLRRALRRLRARPLRQPRALRPAGPPLRLHAAAPVHGAARRARPYGAAATRRLRRPVPGGPPRGGRGGGGGGEGKGRRQPAAAAAAGGGGAARGAPPAPAAAPSRLRRRGP